MTQENTIIEIEAPVGEWVDRTIRMLVTEARHYTAVTIQTVLNGVTVRMDAQSDPELLIRDWRRSMDRGAARFIVGPRALEVLPAEEVILDNYFDQKRREAQQAFRDKCAREDALRKEALQAVLEDAPAFAFVNPEVRAKFEAAQRATTSPYDERPFSYALEVGRLVQGDPRGPTAEALQDAMGLANDGLSGALFGRARRLLRDCWAHGHLVGK